MPLPTNYNSLIINDSNKCYECRVWAKAQNKELPFINEQECRRHSYSGKRLLSYEVKHTCMHNSDMSPGCFSIGNNPVAFNSQQESTPWPIHTIEHYSAMKRMYSYV